MYDRIRDVEFRLRGTFVEHKGVLRYVESVEEEDGFKLYLSGVGWVDLNSRHLKVTNIKTGYMNVGGYLVYLSRKPTRAYRQGLRSDNTNCHGGISFRDVLARVQGNMVDGEPLRKGYKLLDKDYAVMGGKLFYRKRLVGVYIEGKPYLNNDKQFLSESLGDIK